MNKQHPTTTPATQGDFIGIAPAVAERLLGEPSSRSDRELRWGRKGSLRLKLDTGTWNDFEAGEGGGVLALVMREERLDKAGAIEWLQHQRFLRKQDRVSAYPASSAQSRSEQSLSRPAEQHSSNTLSPEQRNRQTLQWIRSQVLPVADAPDHPVRAWMRRRNLWRPELPLPPSLRWIPADASVFRGTHSGAGAIAFPIAPVESWKSSYPDTPPPSAVQLVCITTDGERADYENSQGNRVDKPKFGNARFAVWTVGDVRGDSVAVCEGTADALALAARNPEPVIATLTTPRPSTAWKVALSGFAFVTLWPDMDEVDAHGRRPGLDAVVSLAQARKLDRQSVEVMGVDIGKDAADAAREAPLLTLDADELTAFARDLEVEGVTTFEAIRYASTILR